MNIGAVLARKSGAFIPDNRLLLLFDSTGQYNDMPMKHVNETMFLGGKRVG